MRALPEANCVQCLSPQYKEDIKSFESIQRSIMRMMKGLGVNLYEEQVRSLGLFSLGKRRLKEPITGYIFLKAG